MEEIVKNLRRRRLWTSNLCMLCLLYQLILATPASQDSVVTLNETQSEVTNMETLTKEMDLLKSKVITVKNLTEHNVGIFHKGSSRSTSNITQIERKMLQIQNTIQDLSNITDHGKSDLASIKQRMITLEKELEDLRRLYDNDGREVREDFGKFDSLLTNLTQAHNQLSGQLLTRINELENNFKYHENRDITNFYKAMEAKNFSWAAVNFENIVRKNEIISKKEIVKFVKESYEIVNNFECYMKLASQFVYCDIPLKIYSVIKDNYLWQKNESYADICRYVILMDVWSDVKFRVDYFSNYTNSKCKTEGGSIDANLIKLRFGIMLYETSIVTVYLELDLEAYLLPLLERNRHTSVEWIVIRKTYLNNTMDVKHIDNNGQVLYCEDNQIRLSKDNYVAPIDNC